MYIVNWIEKIAHKDIHEGSGQLVRRASEYNNVRLYYIYKYTKH